MGDVLDHLAWECHAARKHAKVGMLDVASRARVDASTISRWERRVRRVPDDLDAIVDAYAAECTISAYDLWRQALDAWHAQR